MILYHGSNILVENVDLGKCKPFKDFGRGFYCTTILEQAELMAKRVAKIYGGSLLLQKLNLMRNVIKITV